MKKIFYIYELILLGLLINPTVKAQSYFTNYQVTNSLHNPTETFISMPPGDLQHFLVGANTSGIISGFSTCGYYYSSNVGQTWSGSDELGSVSAHDPSVAFGSNGNCFFCYVSGSYVYVKKSSDYGVNWGTTSSSVTTKMTTDKPIMIVDNLSTSPNKNNIYVAWTDVTNDHYCPVVEKNDSHKLFKRIIL